MNTIFLLSSPSPQTLAASLHLPSPKPRAKRPNHLRPKLPQTLTLIPPLAPSPPPPPPPENDFPVVAKPLRLDEALQVAAFEGQNVEQLAAVGVDPARPSLPPVGLAGIVLRFAALIAVQTAVAVWFYGGVRAVREEGKVVLEEQGEEEETGPGASDEVPALDFDAKVLEIRAMARESREKERRDLAGGNDGEGEILVEAKPRLDSVGKVADSRGVLDRIGRSSAKKNGNVGGKAGGRRLDYKRKIGYLNSIAKIDAASKGFGKSESDTDRLNNSRGKA